MRFYREHVHPAFTHAPLQGVEDVGTQPWLVSARWWVVCVSGGFLVVWIFHHTKGCISWFLCGIIFI